MTYLAITQPTATWLLGQPDYRDAVATQLPQIAAAKGLGRTFFAAGALRIAATPENRLTALWSTDYLSHTGEEAWGLIRLMHSNGILDVARIATEVFERCLYVISQRLQGLLLPPEFAHRTFEPGMNSCIAGRGTETRTFRIAYHEALVPLGNSTSRAVVCIGPAWEDTGFRELLKREAQQLPALARAANELVATISVRPKAENALFARLKERFTPETASRLAGAPLPILTEVPAPSPTALPTTYEAWTEEGSPLTSAQRRIVMSDILESRPVRIAGAAGSGKTLVMLLAATRRLQLAEARGTPLRLLYVVHNTAMMNKVWSQFVELGAGRFMEAAGSQFLEVTTLFQYARGFLGIGESPIISADAHETKEFQRTQVLGAMNVVLRSNTSASHSRIFEPALRDDTVFDLLSYLIADEIAVAVKGHGLGIEDRTRYVGSERRFSRLHGIMNADERGFVFDIYTAYHRAVFEELEIFDSDDIALSLLSHLRTALWEMKRKKQGYDYVFVDETQLFNENERRLFSLLTKGSSGHVPIVLALDEAQQTKAMAQSGLGLLGIESLANERLSAVHRSSELILALAFFIIQRTTDLFGPDFPDFTGDTFSVINAHNKLVKTPTLLTTNAQSKFGKAALKQIRALRKENFRQIAVVCHAERYWAEVRTVLADSRLPFIILEQRGERIDTEKPVVVLTRPGTVGGQEFDAVIALGLEQGLVPPRIDNNGALASAMEQQALREMYLSFTRARYRLIVLNANGSAPTGILQDALAKKLLERSASDVADD